MTENERQIKAVLEDACTRQDTATHSPLPWAWSWIDGEDEDEGRQWIEIRDAHGEEVAVLMVRNAARWRQIVGPEREANAERIIRAVNLHTDFVTACKLAEDTFATWGEENGYDPKGPECWAAIDELRDVISRAAE